MLGKIMWDQQTNEIMIYREIFLTSRNTNNPFEGILREGIFEGNILLAETYCYNKSGDRIRTCDLVLPKHLTALVQHRVFKLWLFFCLVLRSLSWEFKQHLSTICPLFQNHVELYPSFFCHCIISNNW